MSACCAACAAACAASQSAVAVWDPPCSIARPVLMMPPILPCSTGKQAGSHQCGLRLGGQGRGARQNPEPANEGADEKLGLFAPTAAVRGSVRAAGLAEPAT